MHNVVTPTISSSFSFTTRSPAYVANTYDSASKR